MKSAETCIVIRWRKKVKNRQINYSINYTELLNEFKVHFKDFKATVFVHVVMSLCGSLWCQGVKSHDYYEMLHFRW